MALERPVLIFILVFFLAQGLKAQEQPQNNQEADQQISGFSLAGFGEKGKKAWDLQGKSADIFTDIIKLKDVVGNLYGKEEDIKLTAEQGDFDKAEGSIHLQQNVVITTSSGAKLLTDSLDWDRKNQIVSTKDLVNITKENIFTVAQGAVGEPGLNKMTLKKDVTTKIDMASGEEKGGKPEGKEDSKVIITCDGPLQIDYEKNIATFNNNVKVDKGDAQIYSDIMDVYFSAGDNAADSASTKTPGAMANKIKKIISKGNVKIVNGPNVSYSDEAIYTAGDKKITLLGRPKLIIESTEELGASFGN